MFFIVFPRKHKLRQSERTKVASSVENCLANWEMMMMMMRTRTDRKNT